MTTPKLKTPDLKSINRLPAELTIEQLIADAGYDGEHHHRLLREDHGIRSLIPPTIGRPTNKPPTGKYRRLMQRLFRHADRTNYGQRWQSETIFSMIKRNLGCAIHARSYWPQCRELLLLAITHNVMIVMIAKVFYRARMSPFLLPVVFCTQHPHGMLCGLLLTSTIKFSWLINVNEPIKSKPPIGN